MRNSDAGNVSLLHGLQLLNVMGLLYLFSDRTSLSTDSTVYKGRKKKSIYYYAIKSVDKDQKARVLQEVSQGHDLSMCMHACHATWGSHAPSHAQVRTMHALDHTNVLKFFAWCEEREVLCSGSGAWEAQHGE